MSTVMAIGKWGNNARMIADAAQLGYLPEPVIDLTYGLGMFWKVHTPADFWRNDNDPSRGLESTRDFRFTGFDDGQFATVVFDPPYKLAGKREDGGFTEGGVTMDGRYGTGGEYVPVTSVRELLVEGTHEACRISRRFVLVKCMDQVASGRIHWQTDDVTAVATACGFRKRDLLMLKRDRAQDPTRRQVHARRNYSSLLVFEAPK